MAKAGMLIRRVIKLSCDTTQAARLLGCLWSCSILVCVCARAGFAACLTLTLA